MIQLGNIIPLVQSNDRKNDFLTDQERKGLQCRVSSLLIAVLMRKGKPHLQAYLAALTFYIHLSYIAELLP